MPFFPDRERKLVFIDRDLHALLLGIEHKVLHFGWFKRFEHKFLRVGTPADYIHLFIVQFADNIFNPRTAHSDASTNRVHFFVRAPDRDFCPITGFPRDATNLDCAIGDFAHFQLKKTAHEIRVATRNDNLGAANAVFHRDHIGAEPVADVVIFDDHAFALGHDGFKFPKVENDIGAIETTHRSADDFASTIFELLVNHFLFDLANSLHHRLLRSLCSNATKISRCHFHLDRVTDTRVRLDFACSRKFDLVLWIADLIGH